MPRKKPAPEITTIDFEWEPTSHGPNLEVELRFHSGAVGSYKLTGLARSEEQEVLHDFGAIRFAPGRSTRLQYKLLSPDLRLEALGIRRDESPASTDRSSVVGSGGRKRVTSEFPHTQPSPRTPVELPCNSLPGNTILKPPVKK